MIHLRAENWSALGDDTFWCWAEREFPGAIEADTAPVRQGDHVLHYGLLGAPERDAARSVALLWEQHPEMEREVAGLCNTSWHREIDRLHAAARTCARRTVATPLLVDDYRVYGRIDVLPLGVDTDLWRPVSDERRRELRDSLGIKQDARVGFWGGHSHPMKGLDLLLRYAGEHPRVEWVQVFKHRSELGRALPGKAFAEIPQPQIADLMALSDFALFTSRLRPYSMLEWEAMSCNLPVVNVGHPEREFTPGANPRKDVFGRGWDRHAAKIAWLEYLGVV